jgi:arylsulfatase A-like enzyme
MTWIGRAAAVGAGFGLAAATIDLWIRFFDVMARPMPPGRLVLAESTLVLIGLGTVLGLLNAITLRSQRRAAVFLHLAGLCGAWLLVESWVWVDVPLLTLLSLARTVGAGAFVLLVLLLERSGRRFAALLWALAALAIAAVFAPGAYVAARTPDAAPRGALPPAREGAPDVVLVVLDTVRADHMASYGYTRDTSPTFDALAREGAWFADATSPATWSLPAHASLFTGRYPTSHGANWSRSILDNRYATLAEVLAAHGYETRCFTANPHISDGLGLTRGFAVQNLSWKKKRAGLFADRLFDGLGLGEPDKGGAFVADDFAAWRRARAADARPAFVFLNFIEAHLPYHKLPREYAGRFTDLPPAELRRISLDVFAQQLGGPRVDLNAVTTPARALYDGGVAYTDELLRRVVDALRESGALDRTILVVLADHGERLGERGRYFGHGPSLYQTLIHVPLLVRYPPRVAPGTRVEAPVSTLGVFATILELAEIEPPPTLQVGSLVSTADGAGEAAVLSEVVATQPEDPKADGDDPQMLSGQHLRAYRSGSWKLVEANRGGPFLFDLERDPTEARNLAAERPEEVKRLAAELEAARVRLGLPRLAEINRAGAPAPQLDAATQQRLRELGYLK